MIGSSDYRLLTHNSKNDTSAEYYGEQLWLKGKAEKKYIYEGKLASS